MKSFEELEEAWRAASRPPAGRGVVREICRRLPGGVHESLERAELSVQLGLVGDRWRLADDPERSLILEQVELGVAVRMAVLDLLTRARR